MPGVVQLITLIYIGLTALDQANATCCPRKTLDSCCGVGSCNIFCCDCDNGCITDCQACPLAECAEVVAQCALHCRLSPNLPACVTCLGNLYQTCRSCFDFFDGVETDQLLFNNTNADSDNDSSGTSISTNGLLLLSAIGTIICILKIY